MSRSFSASNVARGMRSSSGDDTLITLILVVLCILLMGISTFRPHTFDFARSNAADFFAPVLDVLGAPFRKIINFSNNLDSLAQLQADNQRLLEENKKLREWYQLALLLDSENESLRNLLNMPVESDYKHLGGRVLGDSGHTYAKTVLISIGKGAGVAKGAAVVSGDGLIGRIVEVGDDTSRILLLTDINSRVPVVVEDTRQHAILAGGNRNNPHLIHLPVDSEIIPGARIITSGYGGVFPRGIPVGRVQEVQNGRLDVVLFADLDRLDLVRVLQKKKTHLTFPIE